MKCLVDNGADVQKVLKSGWVPLIVAVEKECMELVKFWVEYGININTIRNKDGYTALYTAIENSSSDITRYLLEHQADINIPNYEGQTPLLCSCESISSELSILLINHHANVNLTNHQGESALYLTSRYNHLDIATLLIQHGANINQPTNEGETALSRAVDNTYIDFVDLLLLHNADVNYANDEGVTIFHIACKKGDLNIIKKLIEKSVNIYAKDNEGFNAIYNACLSGNISLLDYLLIEYPKLDIDGYFQASGAVSSGSDEMMDHVFATELVKANIITKGYELLYNASKNKFETFKYLFEHGAKLDNTRTFCNTPLHGACESNSIEMVKYLLEINGNDIFVVNANHETPLDLAIKNNASIELQVVLCNVMFETILSNKLTFRHHIHNVDLEYSSNPLFRYNMPLKDVKLYYEIVIESSGKMQFGCCSPDYDPKYSTIMGSDSQSIAIDGSCQFIYKNTTIGSPNIPIWKEGTIIGIQIDMIEHEIYFSFDGEIIQLAKDYKSITELHDIMPGLSLNNNQKCKLNFGEEPFQFPIPEGYTSFYDYGEKKNRYLQVWDRTKNGWVYPLKYLTHNYQDIMQLVYNDNNADLLSIMLEKYAANVAEIAYIVDDGDRTVLSMSSNKCKKIFQKYLFFMSRYDFVNVRAEHKSLTCAVYIATDDHTKVTVAVKLMRDKDSFLRELASRDGLDGKYIISALKSYNGDDDASFRAELVRKGYSEYNYCIIMPAAERNLQRIIAQEQMAGKDWKEIQHICIEIVECLNHLHSKGVIHGKSF